MGNKDSKKKETKSISESEITLLVNNTSFTREEILQWHQGFIVVFLEIIKN